MQNILGTNLTAIINCTCKTRYRAGASASHGARIRWPCQEFIPGTETRSGNLAMVAACNVAPISYPDISSMCAALGMPFMSKMNFIRLSTYYVYPVIEDAYFRQKMDLLNDIPDPCSLAMDGQYDSPGHSAQMIAETAIEETTAMIVDFTALEKSQVQNKTSLLELEAAKQTIASIEKNVAIRCITIDKHPQVVKFLRENGYCYNLDPYHKLNSVKKQIKSLLKSLESDGDKEKLKELSRRFINHMFYSVKMSKV